MKKFPQQLPPLPLAKSATSGSSLQGLCFLLEADWVLLPVESGWPGGVLGRGSTAGVGDDGVGGEEVARGAGMRLALNPQKSPYLEKCSIRLLISPFALISLLVCAAAVLLSGREGEEGAGR